MITSRTTCIVCNLEIEAVTVGLLTQACFDHIAEVHGLVTLLSVHTHFRNYTKLSNGKPIAFYLWSDFDV